MAYQPKLFDESGPVHLLSSSNWGNTCYRRSVAASLIQGVASLERDRQRGTIDHTDASQWWQRFQFELNDVLVDESDSSCFGAIYELTSAAADPSFHQSSPNPPKHVIAFRGNIITSHTMFEDLILNLKYVYFDKLESSSRFRTAFAAVRSTVEMAGAANVWLAGHSLGASIAMLAGRKMVKSGSHLETYLFNPPFIYFPIERMIKNEKLKLGIRLTGSVIKAGIATVMNKCRDDPLPDSFRVLSEWAPYVYVNPLDPICAEYIGYFENREKMEEIGLGKLERIATKYSIGSLVSGVIGRDSETLHIVPAAYMTVNLSPSGIFRRDHGLAQWWHPQFQWHYTNSKPNDYPLLCLRLRVKL